MKSPCPFSYTRVQIPQPTLSVYLRCPLCGTTRETRRWKEGYGFPHHSAPRTIRGSKLAHWQQTGDGTWHFVEARKEE